MPLMQTVRHIITSENLEIRQIVKEDEGTYICQAVNIAGIAQASAYLRVKGNLIITCLFNISKIIGCCSVPFNYI